MDIYCHDRFYDSMMCDICHRNTYYNNGRCYCINCKKIYYTRFKKVDNRSRISMKNNCKMQHFKTKLNELLNYNLSSEVLAEFLKYIEKHKIAKEDVNICIVENFIKTITSAPTESMMKYHLLNIVLHGRSKPTLSEITKVIDIFQIFINFIQDLEPNFTMKYDFYVMKIFQYLQIPYNYSKKEFKDNTKRNKDNCYWNKFIQYGLMKYKDNTVLCIPLDD